MTRPRRRPRKHRPSWQSALDRAEEMREEIERRLACIRQSFSSAGEAAAAYSAGPDVLGG